MVSVQEMNRNKEKTLYQDGWSENWLSIEEGCNRVGCEGAEHMPSVAISVQSNELSQWLENYYPGRMDFCCGLDNDARHSGDCVDFEHVHANYSSWGCECLVGHHL